MAHGLLLLPHGLVGLIIGIALLAPGRRGLALICSPLLVLLQKVVGGRAPLVQEKLAQPPVALLAGGLIQPSQGHFRNLMPGVALAFLRLRAEAGVHTIGKPAGGAEQLILTRGLIVGHGSLYQMAQAVQLVVVLQVGKGPVHAVEDVIGVQIAAVVLGGADGLHSLLHCCLQPGVRVVGQRIGRRLHPLVKVRVLEHKAIKPVRFQMGRVRGQSLKAPEAVAGLRKGGGLPLPLHQPGRRPEIVHAVAGGRALHPVVESLPLVGDDLPPDGLLGGVPEAIGNLHVF